MDPKSVQTRSESNGLCYFDTVKEAMDRAVENTSIRQISFNVGDERVRLVRNSKLSNGWIYEPIMNEPETALVALPEEEISVEDRVSDTDDKASSDDKVIEAVETIANAGANWLVDKLKRELSRR